MAKNNQQSKPSRYDQIIAQIQLGSAHAKTDFRRRKRLLAKLEQEGDPQPRRVVMYYARLDRELTHNDVLPFTSMLKGVGKVDNLDLIIHSPGGSGEAADKIMDLCRKYCRNKLRIIVPLFAKSAATLMALGGDEIVMGETSEIGPIDAQVHIIQDNTVQQVSADHFLRAEQEAIKKLASTNPQVVQAGQIQLASMSPAFLQQCRDYQDFGKQFAKRQLQTHMFSAEYAADAAVWEDRIDKIVGNLTASGRHLSHGKMITASDIQSDQDLTYLKIRALNGSDPYWLALDDLLQRTDVVAKSEQMGKILMARNFQMAGA